MKDLIPINTDDNGIQTVNARDIHRYVESKQDFSTWVKNRIEKAGFIEGQDFVKVHRKMELSATGQTIIEYHTSLDMGKELGMLEQNDKGREIRQFFIEADKERQRQALTIASLKTELIGEIKAEFQKFAKDIIKSDLTALDVKKADETVHSMGYDKVSHGEKTIIMSAIRTKAKVNGEHIPGRYAELRSTVFQAYGVTKFVHIRKADTKRILKDIGCFDFKNKQLSLYSHLKVMK
jgi:phage anti-repressor protein